MGCLINHMNEAQTTDLPVDEMLLESARDLGPVIREHADQAERDRRPAGAVMDGLREAGLQRMFVARSLGGHEVDPVTYARVAEVIAGFDSVAGWALQLGNHVAWWSARLPKAGVEAIYGNGPNVMIAGAFHPPLKAIEAEDGYRLTGRAPLASNIHDADWLLLSGIVMDGDQPRMSDGVPELLQFIVSASEVDILDTWHSLGMRGTDSNDVTVDGVIVPTSRTFPLAPGFQPGPHFDGPLYRFPGMGAVATIFTPVLLAIGRGVIEAFRDLALEKTPLGYTRKIRERTYVQAQLGQAEAMLRSARALFYETISEAWERTLKDEPSTLERNAGLMMAGTHAGQTVAKVAEMLHGLAGTSGIYTGSRLERHFRDAHTLRHHGFVSANRFETVGQVRLGLEPEFALVRI